MICMYLLLRHARFAYDKEKRIATMNGRGVQDLVNPVGMIKVTGTDFISWRLRIPTINGNPLAAMAGKNTATAG